MYGVELLWPLILIQLALFRRSMSYIQVNKNHLLLMYSFEHILESALKELMPECWEDPVYYTHLKLLTNSGEKVSVCAVYT
ncbi:DUF6904 family protein, partial [Klebsiella pneumoniae]|uniref:DUF6904 family protein n=1 Tax=Klebsiella pneumoniae TaxID=573 RepID=UPI003D781EC3